jgi:hypothetical protein
VTEEIGTLDYLFQPAQQFHIAVTQLKQIDLFASVAQGTPPLKNSIQPG